MKYIKDPFEKGQTLIIMSKKEVDIIDFALNSRMVHLCEIRHNAQRDGDTETVDWAEKAWKETLDLLVEWFDITREIKNEED